MVFFDDNYSNRCLGCCFSDLSAKRIFICYSNTCEHKPTYEIQFALTAAKPESSRRTAARIYSYCTYCISYLTTSLRLGWPCRFSTKIRTWDCRPGMLPLLLIVTLLLLKTEKVNPTSTGNDIALLNINNNYLFISWWWRSMVRNDEIKPPVVETKRRCVQNFRSVAGYDE